MSKRSILILAGAVFLAVALTSLVFLMRDALRFDSFYEVVICNASEQVIVEAVFTQGDQTISHRNIQPGERRPLRFESFPAGLGSTYSLSVRFADGRFLLDCGGDAGVKDDKIIRADRAETAHVRSGW